MSATNHTANIELPVFVGDDKPAWLTDWNGAMTAIDGAVGSAQTDISGLSATVSTQGGQISSLNTTVGQHTTSINTLTDATTHNAGDINTINSLIGNGTPTTTDQTIIGAINELHADQGDLGDLNTTDKSSLVAAINEMVASGSVYFSDITVTADGVKSLTQLFNEAISALLTFAHSLPAGGKALVLSTVGFVQPIAPIAYLTSESTGFYALGTSSYYDGTDIIIYDGLYTLNDVSIRTWRASATGTIDYGAIIQASGTKVGFRMLVVG